jgi:hypothetical protein
MWELLRPGATYAPLRRNGVTKYMQFRHRLAGAWWKGERGFWKLRFEVQDGSGNVIETAAEILINAGGILKYVKSSLVLSLFRHIRTRSIPDARS